MVEVEGLAIGIVDKFEACGFDLVRRTQVAGYNDEVASGYELPDFGRPSSLLLVLGNTRALWDVFISEIRQDSTLAEVHQPLDSWVEKKVSGVLESVGVRSHVSFAHASGKGVVGMQRLGALSGLGFLGPCHLSVHRKYGPWVSFRAAVVLDLHHTNGDYSAVDTCSGCSAKPCMVALEAVQEKDGSGVEEFRDSWKDWLKIRQACIVGQEYSFSDAQSAYHYTHERDWLLESVNGCK